MLISSSALVDNIGWVLEHEIAPAVADQPWLASYLRSIGGLLPFLGALVELEGPALHADNADLRQTLDEVAAAGVAAEEIGDVLSRYADGPAYPSLAGLRTENAAYREQLDRAIPLLHEPERTAALGSVHAYLLRSVERMQPIYSSLGMIPF